MKPLSQKISIVFLFLIVFSLMSPLVSAANTPSGGGIFGGGGSSSEDLTLGNPFGIIWEPIKAIFSGIEDMSEDDAKIVMRALVFLVIFVVFFGVFKMLSSSSKGFEWLGGNIGMVLSFALAVMSCIFIPEQALTAIGGSYGQIAMLILFMPVLLVMILLIIKTENHWAKLALLLASTYMIAYFNMFFKASRYADNSIGGLIFRVLSAVLAVWMIIELFGGLGSLPFMGGGEGGGGFKLPGRGGGDVPRARLDKQTENAQRGADAASKVAQNLGPEMRNRLQELDNSTKDLSGKMKAIAATLRDLAKIVPEVKGMLGKGSGPAFKQKFGAKYMALRQEVQVINDPITKISNDLMIIDRDLKEMARFAEQAVQELKKAGENQVTRDETNELKRMLEAVQRELQELAKVNTGFYNVRAYLQGAFNRNGSIMKAYMFAVKGEITTSISIFNEAATRFDTLANSTIQLERSARTIERNFALMEQSANRIKERMPQNNQLMQPANI